MKRRDFLTRVGGAMVAIPMAAHLTACGDDGGTPPVDAPPAPDAPRVDAPPGAICPNGVDDVTISGNHGHEMTVAVADIEAGVDKTYQIQGTSAHPHDVTVTAAQYQMLADGSSVTVTSSIDGAHSHDVTIMCG
jgi:hypothetical protein